MKSRNSVVYGMLILTTMFWGSLYVANRALLEVTPGFTLLCLRYLVALVPLGIIAAVRKPENMAKPRKIEKKDRKYIVLFGLGGYVGSIGLQQIGTKFAGASLASLINCLNPLAICFFAVLFLHERMTKQKIFCILCAVAGALCIAGGSLEAGRLIGVLFSLGSVLLWGLVSVLIRTYTQKYDTLTITTYAVLIAAIVMVPCMIWELYRTPTTAFLQPWSVALIVYIGLCCTACSHAMWNYALSRLEASTCSMFYPIQPLTSMVLGVLLLHEELTAASVLGAVLIVGGVLCFAVMTPKTEKRKETPK
jgi:drug/metabolite transporter (DMT)-like permease